MNLAKYALGAAAIASAGAAGASFIYSAVNMNDFREYHFKGFIEEVRVEFKEDAWQKLSRLKLTSEGTIVELVARENLPKHTLTLEKAIITNPGKEPGEFDASSPAIMAGFNNVFRNYLNDIVRAKFKPKKAPQPKQYDNRT